MPDMNQHGTLGKVVRIHPKLNEFLIDWRGWAKTSTGMDLSVMQSQELLARLARERFMQPNTLSTPIVNGSPGQQNAPPAQPSGVRVVRYLIPKKRRTNGVFEFRV